MKYTPKSANRKHEAASLILLITAVVMFYFGAQYYTAYRGAVQFAAVLCCVLCFCLLGARPALRVWCVSYYCEYS